VVPSEALRFENVRDAMLDRVRINWRDGDPGIVSDVGMSNCRDMEFCNCRFEKGKVEL